MIIQTLIIIIAGIGGKIIQRLFYNQEKLIEKKIVNEWYNIIRTDISIKLSNDNDNWDKNKR